MALETVVYNSQDPFSHGYKDFYSSMVGPTTNLGYDFGLQEEEEEHKSLVGIFDNHIMDQNIHANFDYYYSSPPSVLQSLTKLGSPNSSSPEASCPPPPPPPQLPLDHQSPPRGSTSSLPGQLTNPVDGPPATGTGRRKRRRTRSSKNKEELENQRMTHIAVERNRRKQMNEYLAVLRSLMPPSYVQRGDQASIIGGAINFVKELEQLLQSMEGHKVRTKPEDHDHHHHHQDDNTKNGGSFSSSSSSSTNSSSSSSSSSSTTTYSSSSSSPLAEFFTFPQYSTRASHYCNNNSENYSKDPINNSNNQWATAAAADIEVTMVDSHANLKILSKKRRRQLLKMVAGFGVLRLSVLHLNVTTVDQMVLYSVSVKIEEGCQLNTVDEIASAVNQMLHRIEEEPVLFS